MPVGHPVSLNMENRWLRCGSDDSQLKIYLPNIKKFKNL